MTRPSRMELRFINLRAMTPAVREISGELQLLLGCARLGIYDGHALFDHLLEKGLKPHWANPSSIRIEDPVAGLLLICFEHQYMTIH
ncbi:hypothetical protein [Pseudomonas proteolytica]|uniref:hypothetical protein n=1 Tax=Pseudomonas proteolytica TaxID=219574 RepID=UPI001474E2DA|nr:hypothetical protein [Pseudomonas proteolytica]